MKEGFAKKLKMFVVDLLCYFMVTAMADAEGQY